MIEIFHVSDLHFGKSDSRNRKAKTLLDKIHQQFEGQDNPYLLVTGDFTEQGDVNQYELAEQALSQFKERVFITPGNHDYGGGIDYDDKKAKYFDEEFAKFLQFKHKFYNKTVYKDEFKDQFGNTLLIMIGLNSCTKTMDKDDLAQGEIGEEQRNQLREILAYYDKNNPNTPKILFLHHIPNKAAFPSFGMSLKDRKELMEVVGDKVDVLAFGHQGWGMIVDSRGKSRTSRAPIRPMKLRKLRRDRKDAVKRTTWLLDADDSVAEQACYRITWNGKELIPRIWPERKSVQRTASPSKNLKSKKRPIKKK